MTKMTFACTFAAGHHQLNNSFDQVPDVGHVDGETSWRNRDLSTTTSRNTTWESFNSDLEQEYSSERDHAVQIEWDSYKPFACRLIQNNIEVEIAKLIAIFACFLRLGDMARVEVEEW